LTPPVTRHPTLRIPSSTFCPPPNEEAAPTDRIPQQPISKPRPRPYSTSAFPNFDQATRFPYLDLLCLLGPISCRHLPSAFAASSSASFCRFPPADNIPPSTPDTMASQRGPGGPGARGINNTRFAQFKLVLLGPYPPGVTRDARPTDTENNG
jgi:hypothetical protein